MMQTSLEGVFKKVKAPKEFLWEGILHAMAWFIAYSYVRLLGELQYIANCTRPDIVYTVNKLATYTANLSLQHYGALKQILQYLAGTKTLGITYKASQNVAEDENLFYGFADAAFAMPMI